jgi:hypothetical protein
MLETTILIEAELAKAILYHNSSIWSKCFEFLFTLKIPRHYPPGSDKQLVHAPQVYVMLSTIGGVHHRSLLIGLDSAQARQLRLIS